MEKHEAHTKSMETHLTPKGAEAHGAAHEAAKQAAKEAAAEKGKDGGAKEAEEEKEASNSYSSGPPRGPHWTRWNPPSSACARGASGTGEGKKAYGYDGGVGARHSGSPVGEALD